MFRNVFSAYGRALNNYPLITQCTTTGKFDYVRSLVAVLDIGLTDLVIDSC